MEPSETPSTSQTSTPRKVAKLKRSEDDEIIDSIDAAYFTLNEEFDAIDYELKKLCDIEMSYEDIQRERLRLKSQHTCVSKKISSLIVQKSSSFTAQVGEMEGIRFNVGEVVSEILTIRRSLALATEQTRTCLRLIANEKKKSVLNGLKFTLTTIKGFYETEQSIREQIQEGNFPVAIQMLIETQIRAASYAHFTAVNDVMTKLAGMSCLLETELIAQLTTLAVSFEKEKYGFVYTAYEMLEKTNIVAEKIAAAFKEVIETTTTAVILDKLRPEEDVQDATYISLCLKLEGEQTSQTFRDMGFVLCRSLHAFHRFLSFHRNESAPEASCDIYKALLGFRKEIFQAAAQRMLTLVESSRDFVLLKFDHILEIVDSINQFNEIGKSYFSNSSTELANAIEQRTAVYFERYHKERMEELMMFIENEAFTLCPVSTQFTIFDLQDFAFLKERRGGENGQKNHEKEDSVPDDDAEIVRIMSSSWQNPFCQAAIRSRSTSTQNESQSGSRSHRNLSYRPDSEDSEDLAFTNLCNTALNILRFFGRYIRIIALLPTLGAKSACAIIDLYEFFFASVCNVFGSEGAEFVERIPRLVACLNEIQKKVAENGRLRYPSMCPAVQIAFIDNLYGAAERIIAVDSIEFVARQLDLIRPVIESLLVDTVRQTIQPTLDAFYSQTLPCQSDARTLIVDVSASRALRLKSLVESVAAVNWDIDELKSQHSPYVSLLVQDYEVFGVRMKAICDEPVNLSPATEKFFWDRVIHYSFKALVQGYGDGGKCSTEGRSLMQLDFQNVLMKLEPLCQMKPVPHAHFVDSYIKAYYLPESGLEQWIKSHSEYSSKQLTSLLGAAAHVSKKARIRILDALKD